MKRFLLIAVLLGCLGVSYSKEIPAAISYDTPENELVIFPNPFINEIQIRSKSGSSIIITNIIGEVVYENPSFENNITKINLEHLPNGIYLVKSTLGDERITKRIVKK